MTSYRNRPCALRSTTSANSHAKKIFAPVKLCKVIQSARIQRLQRAAGPANEPEMTKNRGDLSHKSDQRCDLSTGARIPPSHAGRGRWRTTGKGWASDNFESTLFRGDCGKCRYELMHPVAAAMRTRNAGFFDVRHVNRLGELFVAVLAVKDILGHSGSSWHIIAPGANLRPSREPSVAAQETPGIAQTR